MSSTRISKWPILANHCSKQRLLIRKLVTRQNWQLWLCSDQRAQFTLVPFCSMKISASSGCSSQKKLMKTILFQRPEGQIPIFLPLQSPFLVCQAAFVPSQHGQLDPRHHNNSSSTPRQKTRLVVSNGKDLPRPQRGGWIFHGENPWGKIMGEINKGTCRKRF